MCKRVRTRPAHVHCLPGCDTVEGLNKLNGVTRRDGTAHCCAGERLACGEVIEALHALLDDICPRCQQSAILQPFCFLKLQAKCDLPHPEELFKMPRPCRSEGRDGWGRSYFVEVTATYQPVQPRSAALQAPSVPLLFGLAVLFGAYFSAVASFLRNFHLTR